MSRRVRILSTVVAVAMLAGCSSSGSTTPNSLPSASLSVTVSPATVVADGTNTVTVSVSGSTSGGAVTASASRGFFSNGQRAVQAAATPATLTLVTCNGAADANCAGTVVIRAVDAFGVAGQANVTFTSSGGGVVCTTCGASACVGVVCDGQGHTCSAESPSTCTTCPTGLVEICNDGVDNDCNGLVDCADPQCQPVGNDPGAVCDLVGHTCSVNGAPGPSACTTCSGNGGTAEATEVSCGDGKDNDCNGFVDCQDASCAGSPCAFGFTCDPARKTCTVPSTTCTACGQPACIGMTCEAATGLTCSADSPSTCTTCPPGTITCADPATVSLVLTAASSRIPAADGAETTVTATLTVGGTPVAGQPIAFTVAPPGLGTIVTSPVRATDSNGQTTVRFRSNGTGGDATITGTFAINSTTSATGATTITMPFLGLVTFASAQYEVLGARYSDFQERSFLTYQVYDSTNQPYPAGLNVVFTHESLAGSYIGLGLAENCAGTPSRCTAIGVTDANGQATIGVSSGTAAGEILIEAGAEAGRISKQGEAHRLAITGARANGSRITMNCYFGTEIENVKNIAALSDTNCTSSLYVHPVIDAITCKVALADRFNNVVGRSTRVQYFSEAGTAGTSSLTPAYDATVGATSQVDLGIGLGRIRPDGQLPADVAPFGGEVFRAYEDGCNNATHNPRDGLVTIMAMARGDEGFVDLDGSGTYDSGEPFVDIGEPYVDANDNGVHDLGEYFVDVNGNGVWDGPNGQWDYDTVIWVESRVLFTGLPSFFAPGVTGSYATGGFFDPVTMAPVSTFSVTSSVPGPASTQDVYVGFGDGNFNPPVDGSSLAASMTGTNATATFVTNPNLPGRLGLSFTQMYCPQRSLQEVTDITQCSSACTTSPCYVVTNVGNCTPGTNPRSGCTGLGFGTTARIQITGGTPAGLNTLTVTGTPAGGPPVTATLPGTVIP